MKPLTMDDLLPLQEFAGRRREFFDSHQRYLDRYRRVRIGPSLTLLFENRQTLWFHIQELLRAARLGDPQLVQRELDLFNRLLPGKGQLQAALLIEIKDQNHLIEELKPWQTLQDEHLIFHLGERAMPSWLMTCRPEDRCIGAAHWVLFQVDSASRKNLSNFRQPAFFEITMPSYQHKSPLLNDEIRQSLLDDLELSDRDAA